MENIACYGNPSNPWRHREGEFRYLIRAINLWGTNNKYSFLLQEPERIKECGILCTSLIDQNHRSIYANFGLIIRVPVTDIITTYISDSGHDWTKGFPNYKLKIHPAQELLQLTEAKQYNEVVVYTQNVVLEGFVAVTNYRKRLIEPQYVDVIREHAGRLALPLVKIKKPPLCNTDEILTDDEGRVSLHLNGQRFLISGYGSSNGYVWRDTKTFRKMTPQDWQRIDAFRNQNQNNITHLP